jgi:hypothetical protein
MPVRGVPTLPAKRALDVEKPRVLRPSNLDWRFGWVYWNFKYSQNVVQN